MNVQLHTRSPSSLLFLVPSSVSYVTSPLKQIMEHLAILVVDDGCHFKLSLECFNLVLKVLRQARHFNPLLHLLEELYQTVEQMML